VIDTGTAFTQFGQVILMFLIQIGGLGVMTFTSYFAYFFRGSVTYENQLMLRELTNSDKIAEVFSVLKKIILVSFTVEAIGAVLIYTSLDPQVMGSVADRFFFSVFHSITSFCNAGFSTLSSGFYDEAFRFNYPMLLSVAALVILGGIGFPILFNLITYIRYLVVNFALPISRKQGTIHRPWVINLNTRIVVITTAILLVAGMIIFFALEYENVLGEHRGVGKVVTAFFASTMPRTAGFHSVDLTAMNFSTIMIILVLMWVGASPASTGGGIKTSTLAIATLNFFSLARNKDRVELYQREIADISIRRASAIICLSLIVIGVSVFSITFFDEEKDLLDIAFECFSAYSTVGLSLGITASLSSASKVVIILTMFIGRVSMLTLMMAVLSKVRYMKYRYPSETILIN
jgi:Trk-type K+ transport system membrane component